MKLRKIQNKPFDIIDSTLNAYQLMTFNNANCNYFAIIVTNYHGYNYRLWLIVKLRFPV